MQKRTLGRTGYSVGAVGLGGNRIGNVEGIGDDHWRGLIRRAKELGVTLFDTSPNYGRSEELLGATLGKDPEIVMATKCPPEKGKEPAEAYTVPYVRHRCEDSLRFLRRDAIEVYQLHSPSAETLRQSAWHDALSGLKREGKIRTIAVSTNNPEMLGWLIGEELVDVVQIEYSLLAPRLGDILPLAEAHGIGVLAQMPLARGILSGKFTPGEAVSKDHRATLMGDRLPGLVEQAQAFRRFDGRDGRSLTEIALGYALSPSSISCIIPGARTQEQLNDNVAAGNGEAIEGDLMRDLEATQRDLGLR